MSTSYILFFAAFLIYFSWNLDEISCQAQPLSPQNFVAVCTNTYCQLSWMPPMPNNNTIDYYYVCTSVSSNSPTCSNTVSTSYTTSTLQAVTQYTFTVAGHSAMGLGPSVTYVVQSLSPILTFVGTNVATNDLYSASNWSPVMVPDTQHFLQFNSPATVFFSSSLKVAGIIVQGNIKIQCSTSGIDLSANAVIFQGTSLTLLTPANVDSCTFSTGIPYPIIGANTFGIGTITDSPSFALNQNPNTLLAVAGSQTLNLYLNGNSQLNGDIVIASFGALNLYSTSTTTIKGNIVNSGHITINGNTKLTGSYKAVFPFLPRDTNAPSVNIGGVSGSPPPQLILASPSISMYYLNINSGTLILLPGASVNASYVTSVVSNIHLSANTLFSINYWSTGTSVINGTDPSAVFNVQYLATGYQQKFIGSGTLTVTPSVFYYNGHTYIPYGTSTTIAQVQAATSLINGAYPVCINDANEESFIASNFPGPSYWTGGFVPAGSTTPQWIDSSPFYPLSHSVSTTTSTLRQCLYVTSSYYSWQLYDCTGPISNIAGIIEVPYILPVSNIPNQLLNTYMNDIGFTLNDNWVFTTSTTIQFGSGTFGGAPSSTFNARAPLSFNGQFTLSFLTPILSSLSLTKNAISVTIQTSLPLTIPGDVSLSYGCILTITSPSLILQGNLMGTLATTTLSAQGNLTFVPAAPKSYIIGSIATSGLTMCPGCTLTTTLVAVSSFLTIPASTTINTTSLNLKSSNPNTIIVTGMDSLTSILIVSSLFGCTNPVSFLKAGSFIVPYAFPLVTFNGPSTLFFAADWTLTYNPSTVVQFYALNLIGAGSLINLGSLRITGSSKINIPFTSNGTLTIDEGPTLTLGPLTHPSMDYINNEIVVNGILSIQTPLTFSSSSNFYHSGTGTISCGSTSTTTTSFLVTAIPFVQTYIQQCVGILPTNCAYNYTQLSFTIGSTNNYAGPICQGTRVISYILMDSTVLPSGITFSSQDGSISGTPVSQSGIVYPYTTTVSYTATNLAGTSTVFQINLIVFPVGTITTALPTSGVTTAAPTTASPNTNNNVKNISGRLNIGVNGVMSIVFLFSFLQMMLSL